MQAIYVWVIILFNEMKTQNTAHFCLDQYLLSSIY